MLLLAAACCAPPPAGAAESYDSCTGYIDSLLAVIGTQGTWCLRKDLSTAMASGSAIAIAANNVTIDCNDFKIGGLAAGNASQTNGIHALDRKNATVRNCNVRGFLIGIVVAGGEGHRIVDNRIDGSLHAGIYATGTNQSIRRNRIFRTGGNAGGLANYAIWASGDVADNAVLGVSTTGNTVWGIRLQGLGSVAHGNTVRSLQASGSTGPSVAYGILALSRTGRIQHNDIAGADAASSFGISESQGVGSDKHFCGHNTISGFQQAMTTNCIDTGGNVAF